MSECTGCKSQHMYDGCLCCSCRDAEISTLQEKNQKQGNTIDKLLNGNRIDKVLNAIKRCKELEAKHRWIPVSERLPKVTGEYLILPRIRHLPTLCWQDGWYWYDRTDDAICDTLGHNMEEPLPTVTHFMSIPDLPTGEQDSKHNG